MWWLGAAPCNQQAVNESRHTVFGASGETIRRRWIVSEEA
jgi:hypothetical protein